MRPKRIVGVQARLGSTRLPRKVLADICGKTMLQRVMDACAGDWTTIALIPDDDANDELARYCRDQGWHFLRGPEQNVLGRYEQVVHTYRPDWLCRVCADAPFIRSEWISKAAELCESAVFIPDALHVGTTSAWLNCIETIRRDEHAGHDWFAGHGLMLDLVPEGYFSVNTQADLDAARRILADRSR